MRIKILIAGNDPIAQIADSQLLRDKGMLVFTTYNQTNILEIIEEIQPDLIWFNPLGQDNGLVETYNKVLSFNVAERIPVIYTLSEDDMYLVTRKRTLIKQKTNFIADNIIEAIKMAFDVQFRVSNTIAASLPYINQDYVGSIWKG